MNQGGVTHYFYAFPCNTLFLCFSSFFFFFPILQHTAVKATHSVWAVCSPVDKRANTSHSDRDSFQPFVLSWMVDLGKHVFHSWKGKKTYFWYFLMPSSGGLRAMCLTPLLCRSCFYRLCFSLPEIYYPSAETVWLCLGSGNVAIYLLRTSLWFTRIFLFPSEVSS